MVSGKTTKPADDVLKKRLLEYRQHFIDIGYSPKQATELLKLGLTKNVLKHHGGAAAMKFVNGSVGQ